MGTEVEFQKYEGDHVTDEMLAEATQLFSKNYGIWGKDAAKLVGPFAKQGTRVKMTENRLRAQCLPSGAVCSYVRVIVDGNLAGNAFACRWRYDDEVICWVTQLVVHRDYRERGLAVSLLRELRRDDDSVYGIASSHPAACMAAARAFGGGINTIRLDFIKDHAEECIKTSPIEYIKCAKLRGSLFDPIDDVTYGTVSCADTNFYVEHTEPLLALERVRKHDNWPLGELLEGHEFLLILEAECVLAYNQSHTIPEDPQSKKRNISIRTKDSLSCVSGSGRIGRAPKWS